MYMYYIIDIYIIIYLCIIGPVTLDATRKYLYAHGQTYYISVKGCSIYSGCSISHSDGVTIDATGPVIAQLTHGLPSDPLIQFQASR